MTVLIHPKGTIKISKDSTTTENWVLIQKIFVESHPIVCLDSTLETMDEGSKNYLNGQEK